MLESVKRAYDKGIFDDSKNKCAYDLKSIETYYQILLPAYRVSLSFQKNSTSIAEVLPYILKLVDIWKKLDVSHEPKRFCKLLKACLKNKFDYELNSNTYQVKLFKHFS